MSSKPKLSFIKRNFLTWAGFPYLSLLVWMVPLLLIGIGNHSLMAHDEGLYAWRSRLMYDSGDWINPWKSPHHKTPGFYWLIAGFYSLFGISEFSVRLPNMILGILTVFIVYEIGKILLTKNVAWLAAAILSVEFLWLQYSRLGTPDVPMVCVVLLGILSLLKAELDFKHRYIWGLIAGCSFAIGFLLRSFMIFPPLIALLPYLILEHRRHNHLRNPMLYLGFLLGLVPTIIWLLLSSLRFGDDSFTQLVNFVIQQGSSERENNNWIYYFWHIPLLAFPWSFHSLLGAGLLINDFLSKYNLQFKKTHLYSYKIWQDGNKNSEQDVCPMTLSRHALLTDTLRERTTKKNLLLLIGFPLILFIQLSIFSTRLSHYSLSLYPFIALLAAVGLNWLGKIWNQEIKKIEITNIPLFSSVRLSSTHILKTINYSFATLGILILLASIVVFLISNRDGEIRNYATIGLVLSLGWLTLPLIWIARCRFGKSLITARYWIVAWLISAWLTLAVTGNFGFLSNYNPDFQAFLQQPEIAQILENHAINFVNVDGKTGVLINFYTPKHGKRVNEIYQLPTPSYAWISEQQASTISQPHRIIGEVQSYQLIKLN